MGDDKSMFESACKRAGLIVPDDLKLGTLHGFSEIHKQLGHLRPNRSAESEPASFFVPEAFLRYDD
ncbi:MAG: hypothetical protein WA790_19950 [Sulfitobacter sp.]